MKLIIAFLLGLLSILHAAETTVDADDRGEIFSWDSSDNDETGSTQSYQGIIIQVYQDEGESPTITLGTDSDDHEDVYCLNFKGTFESEDYDTSSAQDSTFSVVSNSEVDFAEANCTTHQVSNTQFTITCNDINSAVLTLTFTFTKDHQGDYGLEYLVSLDGYSWTSSSDQAKFVMIQSVTECSTEYPHSADSGEDDEDNDNNDDNDDNDDSSTESPDNDETTESPQSDGRRRSLLDDNDDNDTTESPDNDESGNGNDDKTESDSIDEEDGISSDDSNEFDAGMARFVAAGQAMDKCQGQDDKSIESKLVYQSDDDELHIVFGHFSCDMALDPFYGLDNSKIIELNQNDQAISIQIMFGFIMGFISILLL